MALTAEQVEQKQNSTPTDWTQVDAGMMARSDADMNRFALDDRLYVRFFLKPRRNIEKSAAENRPIYEDTEYIEIMMPAEKNNIIVRPAWSQDYQRFPKQYEAFKRGQAEQEVGTPLSVLPFMTESLVEELKYFKIHTVEKLATLNDAAMQNFMGAREYQQQAAKWLMKVTSNDSLAEKNRELETKLAAQGDQMTALQAQLSELMALMSEKTAPPPVDEGNTLHVKKR